MEFLASVVTGFFNMLLNMLPEPMREYLLYGMYPVGEDLHVGLEDIMEIARTEQEQHQGLEETEIARTEQDQQHHQQAPYRFARGESRHDHSDSERASSRSNAIPRYHSPDERGRGQVSERDARRIARRERRVEDREREVQQREREVDERERQVGLRETALNEREVDLESQVVREQEVGRRELHLRKATHIGTVILIVIAYLAGCVVYYKNRSAYQSDPEANRVSDALYFCTVTLLTVGFGDLIPKSPAMKNWVSSFIFFGTGFVSIGQDAIQERVLSIKKLNTRWYYTLIGSIVFLSLAIVPETILFFYLAPKMNAVNTKGVARIGWAHAIYASMVTGSTVGYGDEKFYTVLGRTLGSLWMHVSVLFFSIGQRMAINLLCRGFGYVLLWGYNRYFRSRRAVP